MTKQEVQKKIKETLSKHLVFKNADVEIVFKDKNTSVNVKDKPILEDIICLCFKKVAGKEMVRDD